MIVPLRYVNLFTDSILKNLVKVKSTYQKNIYKIRDPQRFQEKLPVPVVSNANLASETSYLWKNISHYTKGVFSTYKTTTMPNNNHNLNKPGQRISVYGYGSKQTTFQRTLFSLFL
jgi:hypothetical protein